MISNREIFRWLENNKLIKSYEVIDFRENQNGFFLKLKVQFIDESLLFIKEYFSIDHRNYSFHWQDKNDELLIRWDNAPFHKNIDTFPHHKHKEGKILPSNEIGIVEVLGYIFSFLERNDWP
ncbi:MAG: DUF6516 family protein [Bacteroidales bacterium]|nr:DUF6516 family protein [Bacteroidales bacterium]MCF8458630.1 DUF6516 family protein [Bacteroidales bacterium]